MATIGMKEAAFHFVGRAVRSNGEIVDFEVRIMKAEPSAEVEGMMACAIECPFLRQNPYLMLGADSEDALDMSRRFVQELLDLEGATLMDHAGKSTRLAWRS
jgi:hypothetical protein